MSLDKLDEEFENFVHRVNQVSDIVQKLASQDKHLQQIGNLEAKKLLGDDVDQDRIVDESQVRTGTNRTLINRKALRADDDPHPQSKEAFMAEVERDANKRYQDKLVRRERMETLKKQANAAFRRQEYEKALTLYNKAIEQIKDSCFLYLNRALTHINLRMYAKAIDDLQWALRIDEKSLKGWLLLAKAHHLSGNHEESRRAIKEAKDRNPGQDSVVEEFVATMVNVMS